MAKLNSLIKKYGFIIHPVLFALFPLLSFYGTNVAEIRSGNFHVGTFFLFNIVVLGILWAVALAITRNLRKSSLLTVAFLVIFFMFGRLHSYIQEFLIIITPDILLGSTKLLLMASALFVVLTWLWLRRVSPASLDKVNTTLTLVGVVMVASTLASIIPAYASGGYKAGSIKSQVKATSTKVSQRDLPDIYYILLDGYARADFLKKNFKYDNSGFLNELKQRGFYIADQSNTNYAHTHYSIPSTFNMKYVNYLADEVGEESVDRLPLRELMMKNEGAQAFKSLGYSYISNGSQWNWTKTSPLTDIVIEAEENAESKIFNIKLDEFAMVYLQTTMLKRWLSTDILEGIVAKNLGAFERTEAVPDIDKPTLTLTHIISPHPPYVFDKNGVIHGQSKLELDNHAYTDRSKFADQTAYLNELVLDLVDKLLKKSDKPPIIVVASDHGPASLLNRYDFEETDPAKLDVAGIQERMGILNTYYFPDRDYSNLYPSITPVNTLRLILKQYLGQDIDLLPDRSYFVDNKYNQYRFLDVTDLITSGR